MPFGHGTLTTQRYFILRAEAATLVGFPDHASLHAVDRTAQTSKVVVAYLPHLKRGLEAGGQEELESLEAVRSSYLMP